MALTNQQLQDELAATIAAVNDLQVAINKLATKQQLTALLSIRQGEIDQLALDIEQLGIVDITPALTAHKSDGAAHSELDVRYFNKSNFVQGSSGALDASKGVLLNASGELAPGFLPPGGVLSIATKTANHTTSGDEVVLCDSTTGGFSVFLPDALAAINKIVIVKKISSDGNFITVDPTGNQTIDGELTKIIQFQWDSMTITSDGTAWFIL
jgi:hypothetical protein